MTSVFAHRGATYRAAENTVAAFADARRIGADGVELDVRRSADGALVVHHDEDVPGIGPVAATRVRDLPPHVPLLAEALDACQGLVVNVEVKSDGDEALPRAVATSLVELGWADRVVVSSFDPACIEAVRNAEAGLAVAWLLGWTAPVAQALDRAVARGYEGVHPFVSQVDRDLVAAARAAGLAVRVWTVNAPEDLRTMADLGVDAVVTDRPEEALAVMAAAARDGGVTGTNGGPPSG